MSPPPELRAAHSARDEGVRALLEVAYGRAEKETRLIEVLATEDPAHDPSLALRLEERGELAAFALFSPREVYLRGIALPLAIAAPLAVSAAHRRTGLGLRLLRAGREALLERGRLGALTIGAPEFFTRAGFGSAFDMRTVRIPAEYLPEEGDTSAWRALRGEDLVPLCELASACYAEISGSEVRRPCALDWEGCAQNAFTLVHGEVGAPDAYLRFRRREELEVTECGALDPAALDAVLRLMRRLTREHGAPLLQAALAPPHPVALALYHRGGLVERCNFGGAAFLGVFDWQRLLEALRPWWSPVLERFADLSLELEVDGTRVCLGRGARVARLWIPEGWGASLLTGQRSAHDLLYEPSVLARSELDDEAQALVRALFTRRDSAWTYGPAFELADD